MARLNNQPRAAEARLLQAEQDTPPSQSSPPEFANQQPECAKQLAGQTDRGETALPPAETAEAGERHKQIRPIASDLLYWKGRLRVLRQAQLPRWRGHFKWQIEARIAALRAAWHTLPAEIANGGG